MRPNFGPDEDRMSAIVTPYDPQRRRLRFMEHAEALRRSISIEDARASLARTLRLTPAQLVNIRKGKLKGLYGHVTRRIDATFIALARRDIKDLEHEMALAMAAGSGVDPELVAQAKGDLEALQRWVFDAEASAPAGAAAAPGAPGRDREGDRCR